jgi:hypothetical protein
MNDEYVRNYLATNALRESSARFKVSIAASDSIERKESVANLPNFVGFIPTEPRQAQTLRALFQIYAWRHRSKSKTFFYRWLRWTGWDNVSTDRGFLKFVETFFLWSLASLRSANGFRVPILGSLVLFPISRYLLQSRLSQNRTLSRLLNEGGYSAVVFPSSAYEPLGVEIVLAARSQGIPSVCLIDNWDNLSSKTVFWEKPTKLGVWGEQAKSQAKQIHGFSEGSVSLIGSPRFEQYFDQETRKLRTRENREPYILFVGSAMPFDEISALRKLEDLLLKIDPEEKLSVIYRPHPQQQKRKTPSSFRAEDFKRVQLDNQFLEAARRGMNVPGVTVSRLAGNSFQPSLDRYPELLSGAELVVGPLTTMLLEASLCLTPAIGLAYDDNSHFNTSLKYFSHFDGMDRLPGFRFCFSESQFHENLTAALQSGPVDEIESDKQSSYFVTNSSVPYSQRLANLIEEAILEHSMAPPISLGLITPLGAAERSS